AVSIPLLHGDPWTDCPPLPVIHCNFGEQFFTDAPKAILSVYIKDENFGCIKCRHAPADDACDHTIHLGNIAIAAASDIAGHLILCVPEGNDAPLERFGHRPFHRLAPAFTAYYGDLQCIRNHRSPDYKRHPHAPTVTICTLFSPGL